MFHSGVCEKTPIARVTVKDMMRHPLPPKFNVVQGPGGKRAEMGVFFAPPECPWPYLVNIELGERGCEVYERGNSGWAFFSHTPVTVSLDVSVPRCAVNLHSNELAAVICVG